MHYDLIIVGGGMVGRIIASALSQSALKIALIDASSDARPDPRLIALNYGSVYFLRKLGIWSRLEQYSTAIHQVHISHRGHFGATRLHAEDLKLPALGHVIPAYRINQALIDTLSIALHENQLTEQRPAKVTAIEIHEKNTKLTIENKSQLSHITGNLIIAADGTDSSIRKLLNFDTETLDYQQSAIVTTCAMSRGHQQVAYERFLADGALALLPLQDRQDNLCASIWTASKEMISSLKELSDARYIEALQLHFGYRLGRFQNISERHVFPLQYIHVKNPVKGNVILIGNAAHTIHPIAAQGLNAALYEIADLSQKLLKVQGQPQVHHGWSSLLSGLQPQKNILFSHYLNHLFSSDSWGLGFARQIGMIGLDLCPPLKKQVSRLLAMESIQWL